METIKLKLFLALKMLIKKILNNGGRYFTEVFWIYSLVDFSFSNSYLHLLLRFPKEYFSFIYYDILEVNF